MADTVPHHVAMILDGNRRWARRQGLKIIAGHRKVATHLLERLVEHAVRRGVKYLTLWAFSTENWQRSDEEVGGIMQIFREVLETKIQTLHEKGARVKVIGDINRFAHDIQEGIHKAAELTKNNDKITVVVAVNYGGRDELVRTIKKIVQKVVGGQLIIDAVDQDLVDQHLDTAGLPDPDLIIRPGGEQRLSGLLPWQSVYSELLFIDTLTPDFDEEQFDAALAEYGRRQRRFGQ